MGRWLGVGVGVLVLLGAVLWLMWKAPEALAGPMPPAPTPGARDAEIAASATQYAAYRADITTTRTGIIAGLAGLAALGGLAVTARTYRLSLQGQLTDRYTKAVEQLGDDKLDIRLGAIYALERLAVDSRRDHPTVVEVLSAYVRERSRTRAARRTRPPGRRTARPLRLTTTLEPLAVDIQAALTVLGRLPTRSGVSRADLSRANLTRAFLRDADLTDATLYGANLTEADLIGANLTKADLFGTNLTEANLANANLTKANLALANLTKAFLFKSNLTESSLVGTRLGGVDLAPASGLGQSQLDHARGDARTVLPTGLTRPAAWFSPPNGQKLAAALCIAAERAVPPA